MSPLLFHAICGGAVAAIVALIYFSSPDRYIAREGKPPPGFAAKVIGAIFSGLLLGCVWYIRGYLFPN
jgi:hypothetical protein